MIKFIVSIFVCHLISGNILFSTRRSHRTLLIKTYQPFSNGRINAYSNILYFINKSSGTRQHNTIDTHFHSQ